MKHILEIAFITALFAGLTGYSNMRAEQDNNQDSDKEDFKLEYVCVGFGPNMDELQSAFRIINTKFVFTMEEAWMFPGQEKIECDTIHIGNFRTSSIDSINKLIEPINDTVIYKVNTRYTDGVAVYIVISNSNKKVTFKLTNASDTIATKIITILNSYISAENPHLYSFSEK